MKPDAQNNFLTFANKSMSWSVKKQLRAEEKRSMNRAQKKAVIKALNERDLLMRLWKRWRQDLLTTALQNKHQDDIQKLIDFLQTLTLQDEGRLVKVVRLGQWQTAHKDIRFLVLRLIDAKLIALREKAELDPFDDPLPGQPLDAFLTLRNELRGSP